MAGSLNKVMIIGNVGQDPEIRSFQNGGKVANLSIATSKRWKDRNTGEKREKTEWHRIAIFNEALVGVVERYVTKGASIYIEGALETRKWQDQSGADRFSTEVVVRPYEGELTLLGGPQGNGNGREANAGDQNGGAQNGGHAGAGAPAGGYGGGTAHRGGQAGTGGRNGGYAGGAAQGGGYGGTSSYANEMDDGEIPF